MNTSVAYHGEVKRFSRVHTVLEMEQQDGREKIVTASMIHRAKERSSETCSCEEIGLRPGMTLKELNAMGCGCSDSRIHPGRGWVCHALDRIRRELNT